MQDFAANIPGADPEAPRGYFLSLGAGQHQAPLIAAARRLGFPVVAVDRNLRAPGFSDAAIQLQCSITRPRRILEMLQQSTRAIPIAGVGCRSFGRAGMTAAVLARVFETPGNDLRALRKFQNKRRLKALLARAGIPVPPVFAYGTLAEREALRSARDTLLVRPAGGHGKLGLRLLESKADRNRFLQIHLRDTGRLLVETLVPGQEVTVLGIVQNGSYAPICLSDKQISKEPPLFIELGHDFPARVSPAEREAIDRHMQIIVEATGLRDGPIVAEFILTQRKADGTESAVAAPPANPAGREALLVECAPEIGGEYLADVLVPAMLGETVLKTPGDAFAIDSTAARHSDEKALEAPGRTDYFEELVRLYTGGVFRTRDFQAAIGSPQRPISIRFVPQGDGEVRSIDLPDELKNQPGLLFARLLKQSGSKTSLSGGNADRLAVFAIQAPRADDQGAGRPEAQLRQIADRLVAAIQDQVQYA